MPADKEMRLPETLSGLLDRHSGLEDLITGGGESKPMEEQVALWKKCKLLVRDALAKHSITEDRGPTITKEALYPLSVDTLQLLQGKISNELTALTAKVGPTSTKLVELQNLHARVEARLQQKLGGLKQAA